MVINGEAISFAFIIKINTAEILKSKSEGLGNSAEIPLLKKGNHLLQHYVRTELRSPTYILKIEWNAFDKAMSLLIDAGPDQRVAKGNAMNGKLGDAKLPKESMEGHLALTVYKKEEGSSVFRRISPIAAILS